MRRNNSAAVILFGFLLAAWPAGGTLPAQAQQTVGYQVGEGDESLSADIGSATINSAAADAGPVRMARFSYLKGDVSWRPDAATPWATAALNLPVRQGAQIWASGHSRAEVQFDDGSLLHLGADAIVTLQTLYSDAQGEFTELRLSQGLASLTVPHARTVFQVDTLDASLKAAGPARFRVGASSGTEVAVRQGKVNIEDAQGKTFLEAGDYVNVTDPKAPFSIQDVPSADSFDRFSEDRDRLMARGMQDKNLSSQEALVAGNLDDYGQWRDDAAYGPVWVPAEPANWRPYNAGHWVWVAPFGWTWVGAEPWGWAPYHYGTWVHQAYGWGWCPGPRVQYWSPAVVDFVGCDGYVAWTPLCPSEVRYPSFVSVAFGGGDWSTFFSIGGCANYEYGGGRYCEPRRWDNAYCNRVTNIDNGGRDGHSYGDPFWNTPPRVDRVRPGGWVPANARLADGVSRVRPDAFGGAGRFEGVDRTAGAALWARGHTVVAAGGARPFAGPAIVRPTQAAFTPTHTFRPDVGPSQAALDRPVYRAALTPNIARFGARSGAFLAPSDRVIAPADRGLRGFGSRAAIDQNRPTFGGGRPAFGNGLPAGGDPMTAPSRRPIFGRAGDAADSARAGLGLPRRSDGSSSGVFQSPSGVFPPVPREGRTGDSGAFPVTQRPEGVFGRTPRGGVFQPDSGFPRVRPAPEASPVPGGDAGGVFGRRPSRGGDGGGFSAPRPDSAPRSIGGGVFGGPRGVEGGSQPFGGGFPGRDSGGGRIGGFSPPGDRFGGRASGGAAPSGPANADRPSPRGFSRVRP